APVPGCPGCAALAAEVAELRALVIELQAQVAELTARLNQNSGNSSKPPSADPPDVRASRPKPPPSGRKPGGQPGHQGVTRVSRTLAPSINVTAIRARRRPPRGRGSRASE